MEALFIKLWVCFLPNRKTSKIEHALPPESYEGTFVGIKEEDSSTPPPTPQHLSLALAVGGLLEGGLGKLCGRAVVGLARALGGGGIPNRGLRLSGAVQNEAIFLNGLKQTGEKLCL